MNIEDKLRGKLVEKSLQREEWSSSLFSEIWFGREEDYYERFYKRNGIRMGNTARFKGRSVLSDESLYSRTEDLLFDQIDRLEKDMSRNVFERIDKPFTVIDSVLFIQDEPKRSSTVIEGVIYIKNDPMPHKKLVELEVKCDDRRE